MRKSFPTHFTCLLLASGALAVSASAAVPAEKAATPAHSGRAAPMQRHLAKIDANQDDVVSRAEYQTWVDDRFDRFDTNHDGSVDAAEIAASPATSERVRERAEGFVKRYDTHGSGKVTRAEYEAKEMARFERIGDGADSISRNQLAQRHAAKRLPPRSDATPTGD